MNVILSFESLSDDILAKFTPILLSASVESLFTNNTILANEDRHTHTRHRHDQLELIQLGHKYLHLYFFPVLSFVQYILFWH